MSEVNYESLCWAFCDLLDRVEIESDCEVARCIVHQRFAVSEEHGLTVEILGPASGRIH